MKKILYALCALVVFPTIVSAHAPSVSVDTIEPLSFGSFPQEYMVTGVVTHNPVDVMQNLTLWVNGEEKNVFALPFPEVEGTEGLFALSWNIETPGEYTIAVSARHGTTGQTGTSDEQVVVVTQAEAGGNVGCSSGVSIARNYLKELDVKEGSDVFKNVIRAVAHESGSNGELFAKNACDDDFIGLVRSLADEIIAE